MLHDVGREFTMTTLVRHNWKHNLTPSEQKEYDEYLHDLRERYPDNSWRLNHNKKYHRACKVGFMQRHCNLDKFVKETCVQANTD